VPDAHTATDDDKVDDITRAFEAAVSRPVADSNIILEPVVDVSGIYECRIEKLDAVYSRLVPTSEKPPQPEASTTSKGGKRRFIETLR
jgi:hypothetical protein